MSTVSTQASLPQKALRVLILGLGIPSALPASAQSQSQAAALASYENLLNTTIQVAERACLSNVSTQESRRLVVSWSAVLSRISSAVSLQKKTDEIRGASLSLPGEVQKIEDDSIRTCINAKITPIFAMADIVFQPAGGNTAWPDPIDFRFNFVRGPSRNSRAYTEFLRADLQTHAGPISDRLVIQDPQGVAYFDLRLGYPLPNETVSGTIVAERSSTGTLTSTPPSITKVCFQRPSNMPTGQLAKFDLFKCMEGTTCEASDRATGWLKACQASPAVKRTGLLPSLTDVYAAEQDGTDSVHSTLPYWNVPSVRALASGDPEGVGYTIFDLETNLFERPGITGVEVDIVVNGIPVREDGLPPDLRPVANRPGQLFVHRFALQTLNFEGARGGCDKIEVAFRPLDTDGHKGAAQSVTLSYVALRDVAPRIERLGGGELKWSAAYITPKREWRNIPEVSSYSYSIHDPAAQRRVVERAEADKKWLDSQNLLFKGQKVVGVLRPARTVSPDGIGAYGLAAGLLQANGQVRFTFSDGEARQLSAFMIAQRGKLPRASQVINGRPYIFQAIGGSHTAPGACFD
jgi:hypothetical protein